MELLLVRHAIARDRDARRWPDDGERPLSPRGIARARRAAAGLRRLAACPARVLVSPLRRAQETAAILTRYAGWPAPQTCRLLLPSARPRALLALLASASPECIALVGHQPALGRLLAACLPGETPAAAFVLKKMGVARVAFRGPVRAGQGELVWLAMPKTLRAAR